MKGVADIRRENLLLVLESKSMNRTELAKLVKRSVKISLKILFILKKPPSGGLFCASKCPILSIF